MHTWRVVWAVGVRGGGPNRLADEVIELCRLLAPSLGRVRSAIPPLSGGKQTSGGCAEIDARDPTETLAAKLL